MEQVKPKVVGQLTQEELDVFLELRVRTKAINAMAQTMIEAVMKAGGTEHAEVMKKHREHWNAVADKYGLPRDKGHEIDHRTGEVLEHVCSPHPFAVMMAHADLGEGAPDKNKVN